MNADNSFEKQNTAQKKILVLVPHQDDEINTAADLIIHCAQNGADVFTAYLTNGDWRYPAEQRFKEALNALSVLGVPENHVFFLGYGDSLNDRTSGHIFYAEKAPVSSPAGKIETYGTDSIPEYHFIKTASHAPYTKSAIINDIKMLLEDILPDMIVVSDYDEHPDHRALVLLFEEALSILLRENNTFRPEVLYGFAYCLAYNAYRTFPERNVSSSKKPDPRKIQQYNYDIIDTSIYSWDNRIRIPVVSGVRDPRISVNTLGRALKCHSSQNIISRFGRIVKGDELFWRRRTDSIGLLADISASSGNGERLTDYIIRKTCDIDSIEPEYTDYLWIPDEKDTERMILFQWNDPQIINEVVLYGNITGNDRILNAELNFHNGYTKLVGPLPERGRPLRIIIPAQLDVTRCSIKIIDSSGKNAGLSECEFFGPDSDKSVLESFIKITIDDDFAYDYYYERNRKELKLGIYKYKTDDAISLSVTQGRSIMKGMTLIIDPYDNEIVLKAVSENNNSIYDQIVLHKTNASHKAFIALCIIDEKKVRFATIVNKKIKTARRIFQESGARGILNKITEKAGIRN